MSKHKTFFCGDLHFDHKFLAKLRGFDSVEEHNSTIITNWNKVVSKQDKVFILGDITMHKATNYSLLAKLAGYKYNIAGNHDELTHANQLLQYIKGVGGAYVYKYKYLLTHIPVHPECMSRFTLNIHGHVHNQTIKDSRYFNTSLETINMTPITLDQILERVKKPYFVYTYSKSKDAIISTLQCSNPLYEALQLSRKLSGTKDPIIETNTICKYGTHQIQIDTDILILFNV